MILQVWKVWKVWKPQILMCANILWLEHLPVVLQLQTTVCYWTLVLRRGHMDSIEACLSQISQMTKKRGFSTFDNNLTLIFVKSGFHERLKFLWTFCENRMTGKNTVTRPNEPRYLCPDSLESSYSLKWDGMGFWMVLCMIKYMLNVGIFPIWKLSNIVNQSVSWSISLPH